MRFVWVLLECLIECLLCTVKAALGLVCCWFFAGLFWWVLVKVLMRCERYTAGH
jgi:uncharacterized membrane protein YciS (DUF1049 family)